MVLPEKSFFFERCAWFKFNNLGLALFVEVKRKKLVGGPFCRPILNRVNVRYFLTKVQCNKKSQNKASESFRVRFPNSFIKGKVMRALPCILNACKELYTHRKTSLNLNSLQQLSLLHFTDNVLGIPTCPRFLRFKGIFTAAFLQLSVIITTKTAHEMFRVLLLVEYVRLR